jgi:hypothetical protein
MHACCCSALLCILNVPGDLCSRLGPIATIWIGCLLQFCGYAGMFIAATRHLPVRCGATVLNLFAPRSYLSYHLLRHLCLFIDPPHDGIHQATYHVNACLLGFNSQYAALRADMLWLASRHW